jgi:hypothetical protein
MMNAETAAAVFAMFKAQLLASKPDDQLRTMVGPYFFNGFLADFPADASFDFN